MTKATGIVRRVDPLGRIVIPSELREIFNIGYETPIEIFTDGESIILQKHENTCIFCDSKENLIYYRDKWICNDCKNEIAKK